MDMAGTVDAANEVQGLPADSRAKRAVMTPRDHDDSTQVILYRISVYACAPR